MGRGWEIGNPGEGGARAKQHGCYHWCAEAIVYSTFGKGELVIKGARVEEAAVDGQTGQLIHGTMHMANLSMLVVAQVVPYPDDSVDFHVKISLSINLPLYLSCSRSFPSVSIRTHYFFRTGEVFSRCAYERNSHAADGDPPCGRGSRQPHFAARRIGPGGPRAELGILPCARK